MHRSIVYHICCFLMLLVTNGAMAGAPAPATVQDTVLALPLKSMIKAHRLEISPMFGASLNDAYYEHLTLGGDLIFYFKDYIGLGIGYNRFVLHQFNNSTNQAIRAGLNAVLSQFHLPKACAHADLYIVPFYGKVSLLNKYVISTDLYAAVGAGIALFSTGKNPLDIHAAIGQHFDINQWLSLRVEVSDHMFMATEQASTLQSYVLLNIGLSVFVPPTFEYTAQ